MTLDAFTKIRNVGGHVTCVAYLGSEDGLRAGWELRGPESCSAKAEVMYTMHSGFQEALCQHHAGRYLPRK
jgi:hypothetical protein